MKTVGEILKEREQRLSSRVYYSQTGQTVAQVCRAMADNDVGTVCVFDGQRFAGVFSERDVVRRVINRQLDPQRTLVDQVMTTDLLVANPDEEYRVSLEKMQRAHVRHLPIVHDGQLIGMLSIRDLLLEAGDQCQFELQTMNDYIYHVPPVAQP